MTHLIQITPAGELSTLDWNDEAEHLDQLLRALSTDDTTVTILTAAPHSRGEDISLWADDEGIYNDGRLNIVASAYAGGPLIGTVVISGFDDQTGETVGLTPERAAAERDSIRAAADLISQRLSILVGLL